MSVLFYLILLVLLYKAVMKFIASPQIKKTENKKSIKYQDAEFEEIDWRLLQLSPMDHQM